MIVFHRLLIATAIAFCAGMALWAFADWRADGAASALALAVTFAFFGVLLAYYLRNLHRFLHR